MPARPLSVPRVACVFALAVGLLVGLPHSSGAQTPTATLFIEARDSAGALLPDVEVRLRNQATGVERVTTTTAQGTAVVPLLQPGTYTATSMLQGFRTNVVQDLRLDAAGKGTLDLVLLPGGFEDRIVVSADLTRLRAGNSAIGESFDGRMLVMMPVENREFLQFTYQSPGTTTPAPGSRLSTQGNAGVNVSGAREAANNFLLDGVDNNDLFLNRIVVNPSLDAIQEFTLVQNTYDAEYGRNAGAQVNVVLKSGGQDVRGSLFEYFRHEALDARGVFDPPGEDQPIFRRHQFGGTIGGPIGGTPNFFFASVEGLRTRAAETRLASVPTLAERQGDFSASPVPLRDPFGGVFPGNRIPAGRLSTTGLNVAALYPEPNRGGPGPNFVSSPVGTNDGVQLTVKTDHHGWRDAPVFVRYALTANDRDLPFQAHGRNVPGFGTTVVDVGHNLAVGVRQVWSDRVFHELRVGWNRLRRENIGANRGVDGFAALGMRGPSLPDVDTGYSTFVLAGYDSLGDDPNHPVVRGTHTLHVSDSIGIDRGRRHWKFGGEVRLYRSDGFNHLFARGQTSFGGVFTGNGLGDLLLGYPSLSLLATNDNRQALRSTAWNVFLQHDWRPTPTLTVNAGVRYELNTPPVDADDRMLIFDLPTRSLRLVGQDGVPRGGVATDWNNVAPRVGLTWLLPGHTGLQLRAGYGLYYDSGTLIENSALYFNPPYFDLQIFFPTAGQLLSIDDPFPAGRGFRPLPSVNTLDPDFDTAVTGQGSLGLEGRLRGIDYAARYVGAHGRNLVRRRNLNQPVPGPGPLDPRRPVADYGDILLVEPAASSDYHALQLKAERQRASGLSWRAAYTWSKAIDDTSAFLSSDGNDNTPQDARHPEAERGLSDFDARHRLSLAAVWPVPSRESWAWTRNWQLSAILAAQSGRPFTPRVGFDNSNTGNVGGSFGFDRPNEVDPSTAPRDAVRYGGRAFVIAPPFTFGDAGRNILVGPAFASLDLGLGRLFTVGASRRLETRLEVYNLLNRVNYGLPESFVDRSTFGESLSAAATRQLQLVARFDF
jgi:hypothetical protein